METVDQIIKEEDTPLTVYILSDSSGETAESVARAALVQFPPGRASIYRLPQIRSTDQLKGLFQQMSAQRAIIAYTLVLPEYQMALEEEAMRYQIPTVDLLGPLISRLASLTALSPMSQPGRLHLLDEKYFKRIEAVDFAIRYDDGKNPDGIMQADLVLTGVSRTSKTPNCMYLAHHYGMKAANVPLVLGVEPPLALFKIPSQKVVGLTIDPYLLSEIRTSRAQILGMSKSAEYADPERIVQEVKYAKKLFKELNCHVIDVSAKAIEETSSEIYLYLRQ
jgi:regulator of PEP synthase PpsR (kinase-PPPase family)